MPRLPPRPVWRGGCLDLDGQTLKFNLNPLCFKGEKKVLETHIHGAEICIDLFPSLLRYENNPALVLKLASVLGVKPEEMDDIAFSTNVRDYVVGIKDPEILLRMKPDFSAMKKMAEAGPFQHEGLMVSARAPEGEACDLLVRVFLPITGVKEDIACGSGNCSIIPYWHQKKLNTDTLAYKTIFPFPEGPQGYVGGVQKIQYAPKEKRISIIGRTVFHKTIRISLSHEREKNSSQKTQIMRPS